jgi:hypothetical protein
MKLKIAQRVWDDGTMQIWILKASKRSSSGWRWLSVAHGPMGQLCGLPKKLSEFMNAPLVDAVTFDEL